jgi:hypothetical protein
VAWEQFHLNPESERPYEQLAASPALSCRSENDRVVVSGEDFKITFDKREGVLKSFLYRNRELFYSGGKSPGGPVLNVYRAPTKNELGLAEQWKAAGLDNLKKEVSVFQIDQADEHLIQIYVKTDYKGSGQCAFEHHCTYLITANGQILVDNRVNPYGPLPTLARMGVRMTLPADFHDLKYFGRGPHENYCDRKSGASVGLYKSSPSEQYVPYGIPQENGARQDVRWAALLNQEQLGLVIVRGKGDFAMTALPFTIGDLETATHLNELTARHYITFCLDAMQRGVGNGVDAVEREVDGFLIKKCAVDPQIFAFSYSLRPYSAEKGAIQTYTRARIPFVPEPVVKRNAQGYVYISQADENSRIYYTLDGSEPSTSSQIFKKPLSLPDACTVKAVAVQDDLGKSRINVTSFEQLVVKAPVITPANRYFYSPLNVSIESGTAEAEIYYTLDGSEPDRQSSKYSQPVRITSGTKLNAKAFKKGYRDSKVTSSVYEEFADSVGVHYKYFTGGDIGIRSGINSLPEKTGTVSQISYREIETNKTAYALQFLALINIAEEGEYTFYTGSNDGSLLSIDNQLVVNNGGGHGYQEESGKIYLTKGRHLIEVGYFQIGGGQDLFVFYEGPGIKKQEIPASAFE